MSPNWMKYDNFHYFLEFSQDFIDKFYIFGVENNFHILNEKKNSYKDISYLYQSKYDENKVSTFYYRTRDLLKTFCGRT